MFDVPVVLPATEKTGLSFSCSATECQREGCVYGEAKTTYVDLAEVDSLVRRIGEDLQQVDRSREGVLQRDLRLSETRLGNVDREREGYEAGQR